MCQWMYVCVYVCMHLYIYICMSVGMYVCMHVCWSPPCDLCIFRYVLVVYCIAFIPIITISSSRLSRSEAIGGVVTYIYMLIRFENVCCREDALRTNWKPIICKSTNVYNSLDGSTVCVCVCVFVSIMAMRTYCLRKHAC
jgi:hypothetical protein